MDPSRLSQESLRRTPVLGAPWSQAWQRSPDICTQPLAFQPGTSGSCYYITPVSSAVGRAAGGRETAPPRSRPPDLPVQSSPTCAVKHGGALSFLTSAPKGAAEAPTGPGEGARQECEKSQQWPCQWAEALGRPSTSSRFCSPLSRDTQAALLQRGLSGPLSESVWEPLPPRAPRGPHWPPAPL